MDLADFIKNIKEKAAAYGMTLEDTSRKKKNAVYRENVKDDSDAPFFGFVSPEEASSGAYRDFSLVFFPTRDDEGEYDGRYLMGICVGTEGFRDDWNLASQPAMRRLFKKLLPMDPETMEHHHPFIKEDFTDLQSPGLDDSTADSLNIKLEKYNNYLSAGCIVSSSPEDMKIVYAWLARYAEIRHWASNKAQKDAIKKDLNAVASDNKTSAADEEKAIRELLEKRRFVVLQGAPGVGKTYMAEKIADEDGYVKRMIQFHAETSYGDFVEGLKPDLDSESLKYTRVKGELLKAMEYAKDNPRKKVMLIIDEINRANLANVLGPVFYLFEYTRKEGADNGAPIRDDDKEGSRDGVSLGGRRWDSVPSNLYIIATMNTADRSIAVVDFALRRRFAWYTMAPRYFKKSGYTGGEDLFKTVADIFDRYASDEEMDLMPGGSYFIADTDEELRLKTEYELMPLIKEYLNQGFLQKAKNEFSNLFQTRIRKSLFR